MTSDRTPGTTSWGSAGRCWTVHLPGGAVDVVVTAPEAARVGAVLPGLAAALGLPGSRLWSGSTLLAEDAPLTTPELRHGAVLGLDRPPDRGWSTTRSGALELHVVGGPEAGRTLPLGHGEHVVGRSADAELVLSDPDVSRRHLLVGVGVGGLVATDLGSTNGTVLDGAPLRSEARPWPIGSVLQLGGSALTVVGPSGFPVTTRPARGGRLAVQPAARIITPRPAVEVAFPAVPAAPARRRLAWIAVALPAVAGVLVAALLHAPQFLFFTVLSPAMALGTWLSERWSGRRSGRRDRARYDAELAKAEERLAEAVRDDAQRLESAHPNLAAVVTAARRRSALVWSRRSADPDAVTVRLGSGPGTTRVIRVEAGGTRSTVPGPRLPVVLELGGTGGLGIVGPRAPGMGILRGVVAQLAVLHAPGHLDLVLLVCAEHLADWTWARWLPHLPEAAVRVQHSPDSGSDDDAHALLDDLIRRRRYLAGDRDGPAVAARLGWLVVVVDRPLDPRLAALVRDAAPLGVLTLAIADTPDALPLPVDALLTVGGETGETAALSRQGAAGPETMTADRLPGDVAAAIARDLAPLQPAESRTGLPRHVRLTDLPARGLRYADGRLTGAWSGDRSRLVAPLGRSAAGPVEVDLCGHGPHALVAGTTGSGKSELLQTLITGLALEYPPDRCSFLLVDYKGGAAFADAAALPHTVGVLTDLDGQTTERALRSLAAELTRRETLLAAHRVTDVAALPDDVELARLVIVVDEFATLADELPAFLPGLVGIAQRGRSLGVHLILATQRPSGVVSPEIRANCTLRICLRTTDDADSRDVLGLPGAAALPVDRPGRAYLRAGVGAPVLFQAARVAGTDRGADTEVSVRPRSWPFPVPASAAGGQTGNGELATLCAAVAEHAARVGCRLPHRPWRPPLPARIGVADLRLPSALLDEPAGRALPRSGPMIRIGLVDRPLEQAWAPLELDLATGGGWLVVGAGRSGRSTLLRTVLGEAAGQLGPDELHVHVLDFGGGALAAEAAGLPHTGTTVAGNDPLRTVRLLARLAEEVAHRRGGPQPSTSPLLLLLVDGVEALLELLDEFEPSGGSAAFLRLVRDGAAAGLTCLLTADRAVPGGRLAAAAHQRLVLPLADKADYLVAGIPPSSVPAVRPPGRALVGEAALECQLALPWPLSVTPATAGAARPAVGTALRIPPLPEQPVLPVPLREGGPPPGGPKPLAEGGPPLADGPGGHPGSPAALRLPIGPGGDEGDVLELDLARTGGLLVAGPPGSGRSTALAAFAAHLAAAGVAVARLGPRTTAEDSEESVAGLDCADDAALADWLATLDGRPGAVVADDLGVHTDPAVLARLPPSAAGRIALLAAGTAPDLARLFQGPVAALRRQRTGLLLSPGPGDADLLGVRLPRTPVPRRPGSGWLVTADTVRRVQVARRRRSAASGPDRERLLRPA